MRNTTVFLVLASSALLVGCSASTMNRIMSSWEGKHIDSVIAQWGYPDEEKNLAGHRLYIWYYRKSVNVPQSSTTTGNIYGNSLSMSTYAAGGYTAHGNCTRILEVDSDGYVVKWQWSGNNCPLMEVFEYSTWRNKN